MKNVHKITVITNLLTGDQDTFYNGYSLTYNLISYIIIEKKETSNILDQTHRDKYKNLIKISKSKITGREFAYCEKYHLHAKHE